MGDRNGDVRVYLIYGLILACTAAGGVFLCICFIKPIHGQFGNGNHGEVAPASENIALTNIVTKPGAESAPDEDGGERHVRFGEAVEIEKQS
ncbi:uncharacterized protein HKW66_Vig0203900 [Vigna angularis]|uniref:Uncharacterized protein n=1 Tax=Phaseolus angularis TaxID=3914 RepID=A0A8T0JV42_PHAAN|nr:uncharacterized protein HKW66_Vig0203900 [Vigna angularis]